MKKRTTLHKKNGLENKPVTRQELREELRNFRVEFREELREEFREELKGYATKEDLKEALKGYATKDDFNKIMNILDNILHQLEEIRSELGAHSLSYQRLEETIENHEGRIVKLERATLVK